MANSSQASKLQTEKTADQTVPVCRPWAPPAEAIQPYLQRIDAVRWYSNFGPLNNELEERLAERFPQKTHIVTLANGTLALALALRARAPNGGLCLMPSWTFVATGHAAIIAGLTPYLVDVDLNTGALTPDGVRTALKTAPGSVAAIVPVLPFGDASSLKTWRALEEELRTPIIVDGAAAFDDARDASTPLVVSMHATKILGAGEGGFLATTDKGLVESVRALSVFDFQGARISSRAAFNAKLSEYHAAVALAALDLWPQTRLQYRRAAARVRNAFKAGDAVQFQNGWGENWISTTASARFANASADYMQRHLAQAGIETRRWWDQGLHQQPAFRTCPTAGELSNTNKLARATLGLPYSIDLTDSQIERVKQCTLDGLSGFAQLQARWMNKQSPAT